MYINFNMPFYYERISFGFKCTFKSVAVTQCEYCISWQLIQTHRQIMELTGARACALRAAQLLYLHAPKTSALYCLFNSIMISFIVLDVLQEPYNYLIYISTNGL